MRQKIEGSRTHVEGSRPSVGCPCLEFPSSSSVSGLQFSFPSEPSFPMLPQPSIFTFLCSSLYSHALLDVWSPVTRWILCSSWRFSELFSGCLPILLVSTSFSPIWAGFSEKKNKKMTRSLIFFGTSFPEESLLPCLKWWMISDKCSSVCVFEDYRLHPVMDLLIVLEKQAVGAS